jgi:type VI protein secretion system component Hcp
MAFHAFADFGDDAKGESLDDSHKDQIQLLSLSHSVVQPKSSSRMIGGGTVDQAEFGACQQWQARCQGDDRDFKADWRQTD